MYFVEKTRGINLVKQFDYLLFINVLAISAIGLAVLNSATKVMPNNINGSTIMRTQIISLILGIIVSLVISSIDYKDFKYFGILLYVVNAGLLVLVLFKGFGQNLGSTSWLRIPGLGQVQPSEIAKVTFVIVIAIFLERIKDGNKDKKNYMKLAFYAAVPIGLVVAQHDYGTTIVFIFILFIMLFIGGISYKYILALAGLLIASFPFAWFYILNGKRKDRIRVFLSPELDPLGAGFNVIRSKTAIGSGQLYGKGLFEGIQTQHNGVPVKESDFIFTVIGEELGFIGCAVIILLLLFLLLRCVHIAKNSRDSYGSFAVIGLGAMIAFHFIQNVGMCIGLLPVTGIPLPFISSGGSSMLTNYVAVGIILSVSMRRKKAIFNTT